MDKSWMQLAGAARFTTKYLEGVNEFLDFAFNSIELQAKIFCPCKKCNNTYKSHRNNVQNHLIINGIEPSYNRWVYHGESLTNQHEDLGNEDLERDNMDGMLGDIFRGPYGEDFGVHSSSQGSVEEKLRNLTNDANVKLYPGCENLSRLSFTVKLLHIMSISSWSQKSLRLLLDLLREALPKNSTIPRSFYEAKKILRDLGLNYVKIEACKNDCVIYWGPNENDLVCPTCAEPRWVGKRANGDNIPHKILRYFPIKPRLQRLFLNKEVASDMRWHKDTRIVEPNILRHPADGLAWKEFDKMNPEFASDARNVRLALSSDGFNPFSNMSTSYSMWPVILITYNLPPWKSMKQPYFFLSLLIPGPKSPGNEIDVFLQPLIKDLRELWDDGVQTYDAASDSLFQLHAALFWTISDLPALANLCGRGTKGALACPVCGSETCSFYLKYGHKMCYMGHRRFLPANHKWRDNDNKDLFDGTKDHRLPPVPLSGEEILSQLDKCNPVVFSKHKSIKKRKREVHELNYTKRSIFFTLPYWKTNMLRHNLDVMHIEKNVSESILGTLLSIPGKNKDTLNSRMDLELLKMKEPLHPIPEGGKLLMPPAAYTLSPAERKAACTFWHELKLPDGYSSNFSRCINSSDGKLSGMKSHDHHVFLQRLLALAVRAYLPKEACEPLIELGNYFRELCSTTLKLDVLERMERGIAVTLCKLERIFPPSFFDIMVHLPIHLAREAILGGPVQPRWMYPLERCMHTYKQYVNNKAHPEGSIAEAYIFNESISFCSMYLQGVETRHSMGGRNNDGMNHKEGLSVFAYNGKVPKTFDYRCATSVELREAHFYVLDNCSEIQSFAEEHLNLLKSESVVNVRKRHAKRFPDWFKMRVKDMDRESPGQLSAQVLALARGPDNRFLHYKRSIINGYRFHTTAYEAVLKTQNNGVYVGGKHEGMDIDFYGVLRDIIELEYEGNNNIVLFKCEWFNLGTKKVPGIREDQYGITSINITSKWYKDEPYILAYQAGQVYYVPDLVLGKNWQVVIKNSPRDDFDFPDVEDTENEWGAYQQAVGNDVPVRMDTNEDVQIRRFDIPSTEVHEMEREDDVLVEDEQNIDVA